MNILEKLNVTSFIALFLNTHHWEFFNLSMCHVKFLRGVRIKKN